ncbi:MAG: heparinase II/III domain-containing protein [Limnochordia bacterium]|jgi:hypothetical protein
MLVNRYQQQLADLILPWRRFHPFPTADERDAWHNLPAIKETLVAAADNLRDYAWPVLSARLFMDFSRTGNRSRYEHAHFSRRRALTQLVIAECITNRGQYLEMLADGIWHICEESFWGVPAHNYVGGAREALPDVSNPVIDLFAAETGALAAWTYYLLKPQLDTISPVIAQRIELEIQRRIIGPYLTRTDFWWMGTDGKRKLNNWTPWCTSNVLAAVLLLEKDQERRLLAVNKAMRSLDAFLAQYPADGGCDEGASYWNRAGGSLYDCLELLRMASAGHICIYEEPLVKNIGRYLYCAFISDNHFVNFADGNARVNISAHLAYGYGRRIGDPLLMRLGAYAHKKQAGKIGVSSLQRMLAALFDYEEMERADATPPYLREVWLPELQFMTAREQAASHQGFYLAAKGGHNAESHNHNDVGQFVVYHDGNPVVIDAGVETYTAQTFSHRRYELWTMQSKYHNLPTIRGVQQAVGREYQATRVECVQNEVKSELTLELAQAYPPEAGVESWVRTIRLIRAEPCRVELVERFKLTEAGNVELSLLTPHKPCIDQRQVILPTSAVCITYAPDALAPQVEPLPLTDRILRSVWGPALYRIVLTAPAVKEGLWRVTFKRLED